MPGHAGCALSTVHKSRVAMQHSHDWPRKNSRTLLCSTTAAAGCKTFTFCCIAARRWLAAKQLHNFAVQHGHDWLRMAKEDGRILADDEDLEDGAWVGAHPFKKDEPLYAEPRLMELPTWNHPPRCEYECAWVCACACVCALERQCLCVCACVRACLCVLARQCLRVCVHECTRAQECLKSFLCVRWIGERAPRIWFS